MHVNNNATIDYDDSLNLAYSGRGTNKLVVTAFPIRFDATALPEQQIQLPGILPSFDSKIVKQLYLAAGGYMVYSDVTGYITGPGGTLYTVAVTSAGLIDYDTSLNANYSGRGTKSLSVVSTQHH
jgi:hypothetical protein